MPHKFEITEDDMLRIARSGAQNVHDEEIVRVVFQELSQPSGTVGALTEKQIPYTMTVSQLFDVVKHAPPYLEGSIRVGAAMTHLSEDDTYRYMMSGSHEERHWVHGISSPIITESTFQVPLLRQELYDRAVTFTTSKQHSEGYADPLRALYGFSCVASKNDARLVDQGGATLRSLIRSLQGAASTNPDLPVVLTMVDEDKEFPIVGVCWIEEDDSVILRYAYYLE